jgi:sigma-E factor negative regulatory protein RseC
VSVPCQGRKVKTGDTVTVFIEEKIGLAAVMWGYVAPLVVFLVIFFVFLFVTHQDGLSALIALVAIGPYYGFLWFFRERFQRMFSLQLK